MASVDRARARGDRRARRNLAELGDLFREVRVGAGLSQDHVGKAVRLSRWEIGRVERAALPGVSIVIAARIAAVLGLDLRVNAYPGGEPLRDAASAKRLALVIRHVRPPLRYGVDVGLPNRSDGPVELRAWDLVVHGHGRRTAFELEMRIRDAQATIRRHGLKRRDDPVEGFVLLVADTRTNRRVLREHVDLFPDLPLRRKSVVLAALKRGEHPPSGIALI